MLQLILSPQQLKSINRLRISTTNCILQWQPFQQQTWSLFLGDFNARIGTDTNTWHTVLGSHGVGEVKGNGERLLDFCVINKLLITNTWFRHKLQHQYTWHRNGDRSNPGHVIDYILVSVKHCSSVMDTHVYRGVYHQSDHELVVSTFRFKIKTKRCQYHHHHHP